MLKSGARLTVLTLGSRVLGLVREMTKAAFLGTSALSDAFTIAFFIPNLLRRLFAENSVSVAFIPTFRGYLETETKETIREFLSSMFTVVTLCTSLTVVLGIAISPLIVPLFGIGTDETVLLTRIMFPYLAIISVAAFFQGILNGVRVFSPSGFTPILFNLIVIGCTWAFAGMSGNPARSMALGVIAGGTVQAAFQLPFVLGKGFRFSLVAPARAFSNPGTKTVLRLIGPTVIGMAAYQINDLVSSILASNAGTGIVSSLQYSLRLQELILGVFAVSIGTVILPDLSAHAAREDWDGYNALLARAINTIALVTIPITAFFLLNGEGLIILLFKTKNFSGESVRLTLDAFTWHICGLYFIALNRVVSPAFYARRDTKSPTWAGIASFGCNIALALALVGPMRGGGIALALSVASAVNTTLLFAFLGKTGKVRVRPLVASTARYALKMAAFSALAALPAWKLAQLVRSPLEGKGRIIAQGLPIACAFAIFAACGLALLALFRDPILAGLIGRFRRRPQART